MARLCQARCPAIGATTVREWLSTISRDATLVRGFRCRRGYMFGTRLTARKYNNHLDQTPRSAYKVQVGRPILAAAAF